MSFGHNFAASLYNQDAQDSDSEVAYRNSCNGCNHARFNNRRGYYSPFEIEDNNNNEFQPGFTMYKTSSSNSILNSEITQSNIDQTKGLHQESDSNYDSTTVESSTLNKEE